MKKPDTIEYPLFKIDNRHKTIKLAQLQLFGWKEGRYMKEYDPQNLTNEELIIQLIGLLTAKQLVDNKTFLKYFALKLELNAEDFYDYTGIKL